MNSSVLSKHLHAYLASVEAQNAMLRTLQNLEQLDGNSLADFTAQSQESRQLIASYQGWITLLVGTHGLTDESDQLLQKIEKLLDDNLELTKLLQPKIQSYMDDLAKLIANTKSRKFSTPHYHYSNHNYYLDLNI